ncbi:papd4-a [Symbiodinium necroappetens]|uniref:Papd4-a protein n=1 Tax=Symbiodinium necroappetens TaxID=1628268 RepID=A0A812WNC0_9DINO|nr:papd4-a [Symbiodinium necroappetens]
MDEVELYSWPTRQEYMAPEDRPLEPMRKDAPPSPPSSAILEGAQSAASSLMQVSSTRRERLETHPKKAEEPAEVKSKPTKKAPGAVKPKPKARSSGFKTAGAGDKEPLPSPHEEIEFVQQNPKKAGGKGFERYELYKKAKTIAEARAGESTYSEQIANHLQRALRALGAVRCRTQCMLMLSLQTIRDHPGCDAVKSGAAPKRRFISRTPWIGACCLTVCFQASTSVVRVPGSLILVPFCFHRTIRTDCESHAWAHCFISDYDSSCRQAFCFHCHSFRNLANS